MQIYTATNDFYEEMVELFPQDEVKVLPEIYDEKLKVDLLIFTGGEDVHPSRYHKSAPERGWFNLERDNREFTVLKDVMDGRLKANKILGVCRGLQLLNVGFGGTLIYDIPTSYKKGHSHVHALSWMSGVALARTFSQWFPWVNSLHHQAIEQLGSRYEGQRYQAQIIAYEPETSLIEVVMWANKFLAVQFHPELMARTSSIESFVSWIQKWSAEKPVEPVQTKLKDFYGAEFEAAMASINSLYDNPMSPEEESEEELDDEDDIEEDEE